MFEISNDLVNSFKNIKIINSPIQKENMRKIMIEDGFIFID